MTLLGALSRVRLALGVLALAISGVAAGAEADAQSSPPSLKVIEVWGSFAEVSSASVSPQVVDTVEIDRASPLLVMGQPLEVWVLARTTVTVSDRGRETRKLWADSANCPAVISTLAQLADVESVAIQPPGVAWPRGRDRNDNTPDRYRRIGESDRTMYDAGTYTIEAEGHWPAARWKGSVSMTGSGGSPAQVWISGVFKALEPCWSARDPTYHQR